MNASLVLHRAQYENRTDVISPTRNMHEIIEVNLSSKHIQPFATTVCWERFLNGRQLTTDEGIPLSANG